MNSRVVVLLAVGAALLAGVILWQQRTVEAPDTPPVPPASLRFIEGGLGGFDGAAQAYAPVPLGSEVRAELPLMSGDGGAVVRMSSGGTLVVGSHTALTLLGSSAGPLRLRLDDGRLWLHLKGEEQVEVSSFRSRVSVGRGDCEVRVYKDADHFLNTEAYMWSGQGRLYSGKVERPLADGVKAHVDDVTVYPLARFDTRHPDAWQKRMLALP